MAKMVPNPPPGFDDLSVDEKIEYVHELWARIAASPEEVPVPDWHLDIVRERLKAHRASPNQGSSWSEVREDVERKLGDH